MSFCCCTVQSTTQSRMSCKYVVRVTCSRVLVQVETSRNAGSGRTCKTWHESSFPGNGYVVKEITRCTRMLGDSGCSMGGKSIGERARRSEAAPADGTILCRVRLSLSYRSERAPAQRPEGAGGNAARPFRHPRAAWRAALACRRSRCHANLPGVSCWRKSAPGRLGRWGRAGGAVLQADRLPGSLRRR